MASILVVDDEDLVRFSVRQMLEDEGHTVKEAADGVEGIAQLQSCAFDLMITDIVMPRKEGMETIAEAKQMQPDLRVIAISGGGPVGQFHYLELAKQFGADAVLAKPFKKQELIAVVDALVKRP
ncbi:response regulator [Shumkonia mesophila]|uniref:response regulator n=1 Tax=Shumkonia mesophila TaxID=2838854 RepID=UPI0029341B55|nr:response regulator [Shumkonia mesophila]